MGLLLGLETQISVLLSVGEKAGDLSIISQGSECKGREMPRLLSGHTEGPTIQPVGQGWVDVAKSQIQK